MTRPWNLPNVPVYSLATYIGEEVNMNICTYVSAVSMKPKLYSIAVYRGTRTLINVANSDTVVLQLLARQHLRLVNTLGKKSGSHYDKTAYLHKRNLLEVWHGRKVLTNTAALLQLEKISSMETGDHILFVFAVKRFASNHKNVLTIEHLRSKKLIRI